MQYHSDPDLRQRWQVRHTFRHGKAGYWHTPLHCGSRGQPVPFPVLLQMNLTEAVYYVIFRLRNERLLHHRLQHRRRLLLFPPSKRSFPV